MRKLEMVIILIIVLILGGTMYLFATGTVDQLRPVTVQDMGGPPMVGVNVPQYVEDLVKMLLQFFCFHAPLLSLRRYGRSCFSLIIFLMASTSFLASEKVISND